MLPGFFEFTKDLNDYERETVLPILIRGLQKKIGKGAAVTNKQIVAGLKKQNIETTEPRIRKMISIIRSQDLITGLVANSNGYYITNDPAEVKDYLSSLTGRINKIHEIKTRTEAYLHTLLTKAS